MKLQIALLLGVVAVAFAARSIEDDRRQFQDYVMVYNRHYVGGEYEHRFQCFRKNLDLIDQRNAQKDAEQNGINQFTDLCVEEFAKYYLGYRPSNITKKPTFPATNVIVAGQSVDWRTKGAVTPIKNQGQCGSCWAFSTTGNVEGQWALAGNTLTSLSEEELVQCSSSAGNQGCNGGLMDNAFDWIVSNGGIDSEADYPYTSGLGVTGTCKTDKLSNDVAKITGHQDLAHDEATMATWVYTNGPLSIAVDAASWQTYVGGIKRFCFGRALDHGVLIVGFDQNNSPPYWIVKNSWGVSWGEQGYIRLEYGTDQCGITEAPSSSTVPKN